MKYYFNTQTGIFHLSKYCADMANSNNIKVVYSLEGLNGTPCGSCVDNNRKGDMTVTKLRKNIRNVLQDKNVFGSHHKFYSGSESALRSEELSSILRLMRKNNDYDGVIEDLDLDEKKVAVKKSLGLNDRSSNNFTSNQLHKLYNYLK